MPRQKPQKPDSHGNSRIARRNLEELFGNWNIYRVEDVDSGTEYGLDWLVEIVSKKGDVSGNEFGVQSKVLSGKNAIRGEYIQTKMKVSTLNYLFDLAVPVLLHFVHRPSKIAYVMWLEVWYIENQTERWEKQKTVNVKIPLSNSFDQFRVQEIESHINRYYFVHDLHKKIDIINSTSPDYLVDTSSINGHPVTIINAKHEGAIPTIVPLDDDAKRQLIQAQETGSRTPLVGKFGITNVPSILFESVEMEIYDAFVFPRLDLAPSFPMRLQYLDEHGNILHEIKYVEMKPQEYGTINQKWEGVASDMPAKFVLETNSSSNTFALQFMLDVSQRNPLEVSKYFEWIQSIINAKSLRILDPRTDHVFTEIKPAIPDTDRDTFQILSLMTKALVTIALKTEHVIQIPDTFTHEDLSQAEGIAQVLQSGSYRGILGDFFPEDDFVWILEGSAQWAKDTFDNLETSDDSNQHVHQGPQEMITELLGHKVNLDACEYVFPDLKLINREEVVTHLAQSETKNDNIRLVFSFDRSRTYTRFPKWMTDKVD